MAPAADVAGNIPVTFSPAFASPPTLSTSASTVAGSVYVNASTAPTATGFSVTAYNNAGAPLAGAIISWIAMGQA